MMAEQIKTMGFHGVLYQFGRGPGGVRNHPQSARLDFEGGNDAFLNY